MGASFGPLLMRHCQRQATSASNAPLVSKVELVRCSKFPVLKYNANVGTQRVAHALGGWHIRLSTHGSLGFNAASTISVRIQQHR